MDQINHNIITTADYFRQCRISSVESILRISNIHDVPYNVSNLFLTSPSTSGMARITKDRLWSIPINLEASEYLQLPYISQSSGNQNESFSILNFDRLLDIDRRKIIDIHIIGNNDDPLMLAGCPFDSSSAF